MYSFWAHSQDCENRPLDLSCLSICPSVWLSPWNSSAPTGRTFIKFDIFIFFENLSRKFKFHYNRTSITDTLLENQHAFLIITRSILLRMRKVLGENFRQNENTHFICSNFLFRKSCRFGDCVEKCGRIRQATDDNIIWRKRIVRVDWIKKAIDTHWD